MFDAATQMVSSLNIPDEVCKLHLLCRIDVLCVLSLFCRALNRLV
jgi:hypothetical protein